MTNIRHAETYRKSFWDWTFLNDCFAPTKIRVSDIDGIVERHGHFLWIETKFPQEAIEEGQRIMHEALLATGRFAVLLIWGEADLPLRYRMRHGRAVEDGLGGADAVRAVVRRWFEWAEKKQ